MRGNARNRLRRALAEIAKSAFRVAWDLLRGQSRPASHGALAPRAEFEVRSTRLRELTFPPDLNPEVAAAVRSSIDSARAAFLGGEGLQPLAGLAARGVSIRAVVTERFPREDGSTHLVSCQNSIVA